VSYEAKIITDSLSPAGVRLTTLQVTFPRFILAEFNTHRMLSRNSASSRAIPVKKRIEAVLADPFVPEKFGRNQKGMQAHEEPINEHNAEEAETAWRYATKVAAHYAKRLDKLGVHKQWSNRLLEPFSWHTVVVTATDWGNFFHLRCHPNAQPEFQKTAGMMHDVMEASVPEKLYYGDWHLPYITDEDYSSENVGLHLGAISAARCARVSYLTHDGKRDISADSALATRLLASGHLSPFEHPARADIRTDAYFGNLRGWVSYRKHIPHEQDILGTHHD
jgi:thymidylate synthase ThyX